MDVRYARQLQHAGTGIALCEFLHVIKARERRDRHTRLAAMTSGTVFCDDRLDFSVSVTWCPSANPLQNLSALLRRHPVGHVPDQRCLEPRAGDRSMIFCADTL